MLGDVRGVVIRGGTSGRECSDSEVSNELIRSLIRGNDVATRAKQNARELARYASPMTARPRSSTHRRGRVALLLLASGCLSARTGGGCAREEALGQGTFSYACPAPDPEPSTPSADAFCASTGSAASGSIPDVAVGAPFRLQFSPSSGDAPRPAVEGLAVSSPAGWSLTQPGWLGFVAWSGSDVVDFTHVHAQAIASLRLAPDLTSTPVTPGFVADLSVAPLGADGAILGGAIGCTFVSSDRTVLSATSLSGRVARVVALAAGDATVAATCAGAATQITLRVSPSADASAVAPDGGSDAAGEEDAGPDVTAVADAGAGEDAAGSDEAGAGDGAEPGGGG
jgi:hypothetical protein